MSSLTWLDTSPEDERRMREIVKMFSDTSTLDDLGIGQIRDALGDLLFPGTSTVHARPRYFLIVPWIFERSASRHTGTAVIAKANHEERRLIEVLRSPTPTRGMIGARAGKAVQNLPSSIYWSALQRYGILGNPKLLLWDVPVKPPPGFPSALDGGLDLTFEESEWLRERIITSTPGTYLAHLLRNGLDTDPNDTDHGWSHPALTSATPELQKIVEHARLFSLAINGATLIYNLLVAEKYDGMVDAPDDWSAHYRERIRDWTTELAANAAALKAWDIENFWSTVTLGRNNIPVKPLTIAFVNEWISKLRYRADLSTLHADHKIRSMIAERERRNKGAQSRLNNVRLIKNWQGSSGSGRLNYRWPVVQTLLFDVREGLGRAGS